MKLHKFPALVPKGSSVVITQKFSDATLNPMAHDSIDWICYDYKRSQKDNQILTYGVKFAMDVDTKCVGIDDYGTMQPKGNGVRMEWFENGYTWQLLFWHNVYNEVTLGQTVKAGQVIGLMGNTGDCRPPASTENPYQGTHCHMRLSRMTRDAYGGNTNIVSLNPLDYFDMYNPVGIDNDGIITLVDKYPLEWAFKKLGLNTVMEKLLYILKLL